MRFVAMATCAAVLLAGATAQAQAPGSPFWMGNTPQADHRLADGGVATGPLTRLSVRAQDLAIGLRPSVRAALEADLGEGRLAGLRDLRRGELNGVTVLCGTAILKDGSGERFIGRRGVATRESATSAASFDAGWRHVGCGR